jgi:hypothetical protein
MKAIVVTDRAAGTAGMTLMERPGQDAARLASLEGANYGDVIVEVHASGFTGNERVRGKTIIRVRPEESGTHRGASTTGAGARGPSMAAHSALF